MKLKDSKKCYIHIYFTKRLKVIHICEVFDVEMVEND